MDHLEYLHDEQEDEIESRLNLLLSNCCPGSPAVDHRHSEREGENSLKAFFVTETPMSTLQVLSVREACSTNVTCQFGC